MTHHFQVDREAVGQGDGVDIQVYNDACIDLFGFHRLGLALPIKRGLDDAGRNALATDLDQDRGTGLCEMDRHITQPDTFLEER